ncbi:serine hydrolase domain-containing protein [Nocardioides sp. SOB77]|uniref:Serine hydrolase domain-containing protein n=1 Tax=Nocardioides oceani TaxID=3058369 RepID=A0ABT8FBN6_9ACTN|nr:serine hydrolase domain-containing protein [Nocardioides oceani]MDN4171894.1 serine hydrolase domain-containing protein [Nocardioides oceani]
MRPTARTARTALAALAAAVTLPLLPAAAAPAAPAPTTTSTTTSTTTTSAQDAADRDAPDRAAIQRRVDRLVERHGFPGAIATVRGSDGEVRTYRAGAGDLRTGAPMPRDGRVRIASNTKTFTATLVLQLVAEGRVALDAKVEQYLPGLVRGPGGDGRRISVRQLLQQTSGLPDYDSLVIEAGGSLREVAHTYFEPHELLDAALAERRRSAPGKRWAYSNTNYVLLGLVVQRVTGRPLAELVEQRIIAPLGLADTYWPRPGEQRIRGTHPRGYHAEERGGRWYDLTRMDPSLGWAAGQLVSSPRDLGRFMAALLDGELLPAEQLAEMRRTVRAPGFDAEPGWRYGLGLASHELGCGVTGWGHGGDIQGFETRNLATPDGRWAVVTVTSLPLDLDMVAAVSRTVETAICRS